MDSKMAYSKGDAIDSIDKDCIYYYYLLSSLILTGWSDFHSLSVVRLYYVVFLVLFVIDMLSPQLTIVSCCRFVTLIFLGMLCYWKLDSWPSLSLPGTLLVFLGRFATNSLLSNLEDLGRTSSQQSFAAYSLHKMTCFTVVWTTRAANKKIFIYLFPLANPSC